MACQNEQGEEAAMLETLRFDRGKSSKFCVSTGFWLGSSFLTEVPDTINQIPDQLSLHLSGCLWHVDLVHSLGFERKFQIPDLATEHDPTGLGVQRVGGSRQIRSRIPIQIVLSYGQFDQRSGARKRFSRQTLDRDGTENPLGEVAASTCILGDQTVGPQPCDNRKTECQADDDRPGWETSLHRTIPAQRIGRRMGRPVG